MGRDSTRQALFDLRAFRLYLPGRRVYLTFARSDAGKKYLVAAALLASRLGRNLEASRLPLDAMCETTRTACQITGVACDPMGKDSFLTTWGRLMPVGRAMRSRSHNNEDDDAQGRIFALHRQCPYDIAYVAKGRPQRDVILPMRLLESGKPYRPYVKAYAKIIQEHLPADTLIQDFPRDFSREHARTELADFREAFASCFPEDLDYVDDMFFIERSEGLVVLGVNLQGVAARFVPEARKTALRRLARGHQLRVEPDASGRREGVIVPAIMNHLASEYNESIVREQQMEGRSGRTHKIPLAISASYGGIRLLTIFLIETGEGPVGPRRIKAHDAIRSDVGAHKCVVIARSTNSTDAVLEGERRGLALLIAEPQGKGLRTILWRRPEEGSSVRFLKVSVGDSGLRYSRVTMNDVLAAEAKPR